MSTDFLRADHDRQIAQANATAAFETAKKNLVAKIQEKSLTAREVRGCHVDLMELDYDSVFIQTSGGQFLYAEVMGYDYDGDCKSLQETTPSIDFAIRRGIVSGDDLTEYNEAKAVYDASQAKARKAAELMRIANQHPELKQAALDALNKT